jgi:cellulose synthase/poly-beta-1,6-N-acetylglucosamine synthase-like glycosyltransferase
VFYVYIGYPALLLLWRRFGGRQVKKKYWEPTVSIVIAVHNERQWIERKLRNCLALDYPKRKLQIIVSLDGPTDGSEFLVWKNYAASGVEMVHSKDHYGKATALNRALRRAKGEIVVFADARQTFDLDVVRELTANFADETVGAVSGELMLEPSPGASREGEGIGLYWRYEKALRAMESQIHSVTGATGAIYAIRRSLYEDLPEDTILDDVLTPLRIVMQGKRAVFEPRAKAYDTVACCPLAEYRRKVRTLCGNYQLAGQLPQLLVPWRNPIFVQFVSHKLGRLLVPWALLTLFVTNLMMLRGIYLLSFLIQSTWYACALAGYGLSKRDTLAPIPLPSVERAA